jgi:hypothetical protein
MSEIELLKGVRVFDVSQGMAQGKNNQVKLILSLSFIPYALRPMPYASSAGIANCLCPPQDVIWDWP